jgi:hypothetical protein
MLIELWERLRGYDKWIETQAKSRFRVGDSKSARQTLPGIT